MRRNILFPFLLLLSILITVEVDAQKAKKKTPAAKGAGAAKTTGTPKAGGSKAGAAGTASKKKKKKKGAAEDAAPTTTTTTPAADPAATEPVVMEDTGVSTPEIIAENIDSFDFKSIVLDTSKPKLGYYKLSYLKGAKPFPFPEQNKNTVKFYRRLWRQISTTDSENAIFAIPGETLIQFIMDGIKNGKIIAYADDGFRKKLSYKQVYGSFRDSAIVNITDSMGQVTGSKTVATEFNPDSVTRFEIVEDMFFDKVRGRMVTEIIAIGPVSKLKTTTGEYISDKHPFYLDFNKCRRLFAAKEVIDPQREIYNISFDDIFLQRAFKSTIIKESNPANMKISDKFPDKERQAKEALRIEHEIMRYKRSLWKY